MTAVLAIVVPVPVVALRPPAIERCLPILLPPWEPCDRERVRLRRVERKRREAHERADAKATGAVRKADARGEDIATGLAEAIRKRHQQLVIKFPWSRDDGPRGLTLNLNKLTRAEEMHFFGEVSARELEAIDAIRPKTRGDCKGGFRPCPFVSCAMHLALDVHDVSENPKLNFPQHVDDDGDIDLWQFEETCVLDVADRVEESGGDGSIELSEVGRYLNLGIERVRQLSTTGLQGMRRAEITENVLVNIRMDGYRAQLGRASKAEPRRTDGDDET